MSNHAHNHAFRHDHSHQHGLSTVLAASSTSAQARRIRHVVIIGCIVNFVLMALKLTVGKLGHSDALFADGFHSLNDVAADLIMLVFVGISYKAADEKYAYGYGKFETFSSFLISAFLIVVALMIGAEAVEKIIGYAHGETLQQPNGWTVVVILVAIAAKEFLFRYYSYEGKKAGSKALAANAWHHRSDALSSVATLIGVTCAHFFGPAFRILDPCASIVIAVFILVPAIRMIRPAFLELMERSIPVKDVAAAREAVASVEGVKEVKYLRVRRNGHYIIPDVGIKVDPKLTVEQTAPIAAAVGKALAALYGPQILPSISVIP